MGWHRKVAGRNLYFIYATERDKSPPSSIYRIPDTPEDKPYWALIYRDSWQKGSECVKITFFKTRAAAKRSVYRSYKTHARKLAKEKAKRDAGYIPPKLRCGKCESARKLDGDYLCWECRYGS